MEKKEITVTPPVTYADHTFLAVIETTVAYGTSGAGLALRWERQPVAVIIKSQQSIQAFLICGEQIPLNDLAKKFPEAGNMLSACNF